MKPWWREYWDDPLLLLRWPILILIVIAGHFEYLLARYHAWKHPDRGI